MEESNEKVISKECQKFTFEDENLVNKIRELRSIADKEDWKNEDPRRVLLCLYAEENLTVSTVLGKGDLLTELLTSISKDNFAIRDCILQVAYNIVHAGEEELSNDILKDVLEGDWDKD